MWHGHRHSDRLCLNPSIRTWGVGHLLDIVRDGQPALFQERKKYTHLCLAFTQHRVWSPGACQWRPPISWRWAFLSHFSIAASMVNTTPNIGCILPDPILYILGPGGFKFLLTDWTRSIPQSRIIGRADPRLGRSLFRYIAIMSISCVARGFCVCRILVVSCFSGFDPILTLFLACEPPRNGLHRKIAYHLPVRQRTNFDSGPAWQRRTCVGWCGSANPGDAPSSPSLLRSRRIYGHTSHIDWCAFHRGC